MLSRLYVLILLFLTEHPGGVFALVAGIVSACEKVLGLLFGGFNNKLYLCVCFRLSFFIISDNETSSPPSGSGVRPPPVTTAAVGPPGPVTTTAVGTSGPGPAVTTTTVATVPNTAVVSLRCNHYSFLFIIFRKRRCSMEKRSGRGQEIFGYQRIPLEHRRL